MVNLGKEHWNVVKKVLRYIKGTTDIAFNYGESNFIVREYVNSDYAGDLDKNKSTTKYMFALASGAVS